MNGISITATITILILKVDRIQSDEEAFCPSINTPAPPITSTCWDWNPVDPTISLQTGCDNVLCEEAVCNCDPYCCEKSWDLACVGYSSESSNFEYDNPFQSGCSAFQLCCGGSVFDQEVLKGRQVICYSDNSTIGYETLDALNEDLAKIEKNELDDKAAEIFVICPDAIFTLKSDEDGIQPKKSNIRIQCGIDGSSSNNCLLKGGSSQVLFDNSEVVSNVVFQGLTFEGSTGASVSAWGPKESSASFLDCHWKKNIGYDTIDILFQESSGRRLKQKKRMLQDYFNVKKNLLRTKQSSLLYKNRLLQSEDNEQTGPLSMTLVFTDCSFIENRQNIGVILNVGGIVQIIQSVFRSNVVAGVTVGVAGGGRLLVDPTSTFYNNSNYFSTIFSDQQSSLTMSELTKGYNNTGNICNDIFQEAPGSACLSSGSDGDSVCNGTCTAFGEV